MHAHDWMFRGNNKIDTDVESDRALSLASARVPGGADTSLSTASATQERLRLRAIPFEGDAGTTGVAIYFHLTLL